MTQKNKNILFVVGFMLSLFVAYQLAFSKTIDIKEQVNRLEEQNIGSKELAVITASLRQREKNADSILQKNNIKSNSVQNNLLEFLNNSSLKNDFAIADFKEPHTIRDNNLTTTSFQFTIKGSFKELLKVIYNLEQNYNFGSITHVNFEKKRDYRKQRDYLECFVVVESFVSQ